MCERLVPELEVELGRESVPAAVVTAGDNEDRTGEFLGAVARSLLGPRTELGFPLIGLMDAKGQLHAIYVGDGVTGAELALDARQLAGEGAVINAHRSAVGALDGRARWFHRGIRSVQVLIHELRRVELNADADAYSSMTR